MSRVVAIETRDVIVIDTGHVGPPGARGEQGEPGEPGEPGDETLILKTASEALSAFRAVVADGADGALLAQNTNVAHRDKSLGVTETAASISTEVRIRRFGTLDHAGWSWTPDGLIFVGTNGALTQTPPAAPAVFSLAIGVALTATRMYVWPREPMTII